LGRSVTKKNYHKGMHILIGDSRDFVPVSKSFNSEQVHTEHQLTNSCHHSVASKPRLKGENVRNKTFTSLQFLFYLPLRYIFDQGLETRAHVTIIKISCSILTKFAMNIYYKDRLCGLVVRVSGYRYRALGFDSRRYQIF